MESWANIGKGIFRYIQNAPSLEILSGVLLGHVRIARHSKTGQYAAIKIIPKNSLASRVSLNRLADEVEHNLLAVEREIVVMKLIDHPNVMKLYDVWETSTSLYLILEYVQGGELFDYLCSKGRRPIPEVVGYFQQIICAVNYCHRYNIAHRDLKLENILIDHESNIKVADFGMATWQDGSPGNLLLTSCGSPHYAAPEIIAGKPYDGSASDIWSCGVILYALLAAKLPFDDDDCPTLLRKISIGRFDMPRDIEPDARDLITRMLTTDVNKRITMRDIMRHPFFLSQPLKNPAAMPSDPNMATIAHPIGNRSSIDPDIFANLRTLWHDTPDAELIESLMNSERNWQKGIYHLLVNYRRKYHDIRQQEEEEHQAAERRKKKEGGRKSQALEASLPPRTSAPTPRRARGRDHLPASSEGSLNHIHLRPELPTISFSAPSPEKTGPSDQSGGTTLPSLAAPELEDAKIQQFFQQIANHLNVIQAKTVTTHPKVNASNSSSVEVLASNLNGSIFPSTPIRNKNDTFPVDPNDTKPLTIRRKPRGARPPITIDTNDKENAIPITESDLLHRHSPLARHSKMMSDDLGNLEVYERPTPHAAFRRPSQLKKRLSAGPISPMFSEAGSSFNFPSPVGSPKRSWLDNVFKFKQATYNLLSRHDVHTTRSECRRLLMEMDLLVSLEDSEKLGLLKCRTRDLKDANSVLPGLKAVKFRVEMQWPTPQLCHDGYLVSLLLVQEKGSLEAFKGIYRELERRWTLGFANRPSSVVSLTPSSINRRAGYLDQY